MRTFSDDFKLSGKDRGSLHHAYGISGERDIILEELPQFFKIAFHFSTQGNPDYFLEKFDVLLAEDSRRIKEMQIKKPFGEKKIIVLAFNNASAEAQNALLKALEEPAAHTHFFVVVPQIDILLPTVRSRLFVVESVQGAVGDDVSNKANEFLKASLTERILLAKDMAGEVTDGAVSKQFVVDFLGRIEAILADRLRKKELSPSVLEDIIRCRSYAADSSASVKMLLEFAALVIPSTSR